jgi:hypothetical protein
MSAAVGIGIAALLDRASENKRLVESQTEEQKEKGRTVSVHHWLVPSVCTHSFTEGRK